MSNHIHCPHCGGLLVDDGSLAGQPVACPGCTKQFTMPGLPVAQQVFPQFQQIRVTPAQTRIEQRQQSICGVASFVLGLFCAMYLLFALLIDLKRYDVGESFFPLLTGMMSISMSMIGIIGVGIGIAGLTNPNRRHGLALVGACLSAIAPLIVFTLLLLNIVNGRSGY